MIRGIFAGVMLAMMPVAAWATIGAVSNITVDKDVLTVSTRQAYGVDGDQRAIDARWRSRYTVDYGVTDDYAVGFFVQTDKRRGDNLELEALMLDQRFELHDVEHDGFYSGFRVRYTKRDGDKSPDDVHLRLILGKPVGPWDFRFNQLFIHEVGKDSRDGIFLESRTHVSYGLASGQRVGLETFSHFGPSGNIQGYDTQNHEVGPVLLGSLENGVNYDVSYRKGISDAASDHVFRLVLTKPF